MVNVVAMMMQVGGDRESNLVGSVWMVRGELVGDKGSVA